GLTWFSKHAKAPWKNRDSERAPNRDPCRPRWPNLLCAGQTAVACNAQFGRAHLLFWGTRLHGRALPVRAGSPQHPVAHLGPGLAIKGKDVQIPVGAVPVAVSFEHAFFGETDLAPHAYDAFVVPEHFVVQLAQRQALEKPLHEQAGADHAAAA